MSKQTKYPTLARIIFDTDTPLGWLYDICLIGLITLSVILAMLDSLENFPKEHKILLSRIEWSLTILFTLDYITRLICAPRTWRYALSFYGIIDLLSVIPSYMGLAIGSKQHLTFIRFLRVLRVFRVLHLSTYQVELQRLGQAIVASQRRITAFLFFILTIIVILGALMYSIEYSKEDPNEEFTSIPRSIYWAIVTLTTVGYGDISPKTPLGQTIAALIMILGYSIIVIPTGIIAAAVPKTAPPHPERLCTVCEHTQHDSDAIFCSRCGAKL